MTILNASNSSVGLNINFSMLIPNNATSGTADATTGKTSTGFTEIFDSGWEMAFSGTFANYVAEDGEGPDGKMNFNIEYPSSGLVNSIVASYQGQQVYTWSGLSWNFTESLGSTEDRHKFLFAASDTINGGLAADILAGFGGNDIVNGGDGIDTALYLGSRANYAIAPNDTGYVVTDSSGLDGSDTLVSIERLEFADAKVALDITDNALETMQFIGVIASTLKDDLAIRGVVLSYFDQGHSMVEACLLALDAGWVPSDNTALVKAAFKSVFETTTDPDQGVIDSLLPYVDELGDAGFLAAVAGLNINVDLVGLQLNGMAYA
jgi:Ca2+-binding RTX toxin-like protein